MEIKKDIREQVHKKYDYKCGYCGDNIKNILSEKLNLIK